MPTVAGQPVSFSPPSSDDPQSSNSDDSQPPVAAPAIGEAAAPPGSHQDNIQDRGYASPTYCAFVHQPIPIKQALQIPEAKAALTKEWDKLDTLPAFDYCKVRELRDVQNASRASGQAVHIGDLMELCHKKHAELAPAWWQYKGRIVFRGDNVRDESGHFAVFSEQGTSASLQSSIKILDAIARMPGCHGQNADAKGAYTQAPYTGTATWVRIPRHR